MDYLDTKKEARHRSVMLTGYICLAIAIVIATLILLYQAYGFGLGKNGQVVQNGLVFFSSEPNPADIYVNGKLNRAKTNSRVTLQSGIYKLTLARSGYQDWKRQIEVEGGDVQHFDYPRLFPKVLQPKVVKSYSVNPGLMTQSPDRRWVLVQPTTGAENFEVFDLKNIEKAPAALQLPNGIATKSATSTSWGLVEWADDNQHVLLEHSVDGKIEYVLVDRVDPSKSLNITSTIKQPSTKLTLLDKKYDRFVIQDAAGALKTYKLNDPSATAWVDKVLAYKTYGTDTVLYATDTGSPAGKVAIRLKIGERVYPVRLFPAGSNYMVDLTKYSGDLYVGAGSSSQSKVYIYKDPPGQLKSRPKQALIPSQVLHVSEPNYLSFSQTAQFIVAEHGNQFGVYDIENKRGYNFTTTQPIDSGASHAEWMDGHRMTYSSGGRLLVFDYDYTNYRILSPAAASYLPGYEPDYKFTLTLSPSSTVAGQMDLVRTPLLTPADQ